MDDLEYEIETLGEETLKPKPKWYYLKRTIFLLTIAVLLYLFVRYVLWRI